MNLCSCVLRIPLWNIVTSLITVFVWTPVWRVITVELTFLVWGLVDVFCNLCFHGSSLEMYSFSLFWGSVTVFYTFMFMERHYKFIHFLYLRPYICFWQCFLFIIHYYKFSYLLLLIFCGCVLTFSGDFRLSRRYMQTLTQFLGDVSLWI